MSPRRSNHRPPKTAQVRDTHDPVSLTDHQWNAISSALRLSPREQEIVRLIMCGRTEGQIADHLDISPHTVHSHLDRLYRKLGVTRRAAVVTRIFGAFLEIDTE